MKKYTLFILLFVSLNSFGQQFLWTTNKNGLYPNSEMKVISKEDVLKKLLGYYETYRYYYDFTGYTRNGFFREVESSSWFNEYDNKNWGEFKKSVSEINELTITGIKYNSGDGSNITILIINKDNFELINFSNEIKMGGISTYNGKFLDDKNRFIKFYRSLIED